jgi:hypothetical protein
MRKTVNKISKTGKYRELTGKRYQQSIQKFAPIPIFTPADDEEYFFETEDV